ncbi:MAG: shikimate kinase [Chthoniobacterales bacterium]|nr:shikimate kinase [Chthoniobacterales bacterium]
MPSLTDNLSPVTCMPANNIILIGFMGSGKSSIGKQLAKQLQYDCLDTDELIVAKTGKNIAALFEEEGEARFRACETEILEALSASFEKSFVLSTGGGIILSEKNRVILKSLGTVIWLNASPEVLFERATRQSKRPLLEVEYPRRTFDQLLAKRLSLYQETCNLEIDTTELSYSKTVAELLKQLLKS